MLSYQNQGLEVDSCPECFGIWFDREELKEFIQRPELAQRLSEGVAGVSAAPAGERLCPTCRVALSETNLGEVSVDLCFRCRGIWLDQGELDRAVEQYRQGQRGNLVVLNQIAEGLRAARGG
ncbi:MAG: zf-TFIIB domain-containing protein [Candidatus Eremiobacteraeota bacterium]|nr:zf-TFIIB domain-containing protein [Candidatus Eremiobacteraeota bacterium]